MDWLGFFGLILFVIAIALLWMMKLNSIAKQHTAPDDSTLQHNLRAESVQRHFDGMPVLAPIRQQVPVEEGEPANLQDLSEQQERVVVVAPAPDLIATNIPDDEQVQRMLEIVEQLDIIGDYEGRDEYLKLILENQAASPGQRARANAMSRLDSIS
ncbi:hypothetical protein [Pseudomonas guariconensis]|uniref:hypothetical protein n=1 Tax=Pseudomonas guariconensis TaxID=1288410 RepID=UPI003905BF21